MTELTKEERRARIAEIDRWLFIYDMKDYHNDKDRSDILKLQMERESLCDTRRVWCASFTVKHKEMPKKERGCTFWFHGEVIECIHTTSPREIEELRNDPNATEHPEEGYYKTFYVDP